MKQFFVLLALLSATAAHATTVKIDTVDAYYQPSTSTMGSDVRLQNFRFEVNPDAGRARVLISYLSNYPTNADDGYVGPDNSQVLVKGLTFDAAGNRVVFTSTDGKVTNCADVTIKQGGIFGRRIKVKNTGLCTLSTSVEEVQTDDGWEIKIRKVLNVFLNVRD